MNTKKWMMILCLLTLAAMLSACGGSKTPGDEAGKESKQQQQQQSPKNNNKVNETEQGKEEAPNVSDREGGKEADNTPTDQGNGQAEQSGAQKEIPSYLPKEFPLPADVKVQTAHSEQKGGKKYVLLIFTTHEELADVTKMYKEFFKADKFTISSELTDKKNLIYQVEDTEQQQSWSLIGGLADSEAKDKITEITLTWEEV